MQAHILYLNTALTCALDIYKKSDGRTHARTDRRTTFVLN